MNSNKLKVKLTVMLIVLSSAPLIFFGLVAYKKEADLARKKAVMHLETIVVQNVLIVDRFRSECINDLKLLAASLRGSNEGRAASRIKSMRAQRAIYRYIFIADTAGKIRHASGSNKALGKDLAKQKWFKTVVSGNNFTGDVSSYEYRGKLDLLVAVPIRSFGGEVMGVLAAIVDFSGVAEVMRNTGIGRTGEIYLVNGENVFLTTTRIGNGKPGVKAVAKQTTKYSGKLAPDEYIDYRGVRVMRAYKRMYDLGWTLFVEQDSAEVFRDIGALRNTFIFLAGFLIMLAAASSYVISVKIARLLQKAYEREKDLEMQIIQKDKLATMGLLTAGIAHELNTPLASALLNTQILKEDTRQTWPEHAEVLNSIEEEIKRGGTIVRNLLEFSRQSQRDSAVTDVNDVLKKLLDIAGKLCSDKKIIVRQTLAAGIPLAKGNASILHQVFMNIVSNAVEAMENGGTLSVLTKYTPALHKVIVEIRDSGPGIPDKNIDGIFDPFFTTKASEDGTGLGLAISYAMIKKMGGDIRVTSSCRVKEDSPSSSTGTTFSIELPAHDRKYPYNENKEGERG